MALICPSPITPDHQRGAALLVFMLIFFLASMSWLLSQTDALRSRARADQTTAAALAQAREALIGRAAADKERPGSLPCPDFDDDGEATNGSCSVTVGRLPWKTLDLPDLRDGEGNRLWYAMASELQDNDDSPEIDINPELALGLSLDGKENIAAIVFSAGPPLAGQNGRPTSNEIKDYLDGANKEDGTKTYVSGPTSSTFNDRAIAISHEHLFKIVIRGVLGLISADLNAYYAIKESKYPSSDLKTALNDLVLDPYFAPTDKKKEKEALEKRIAMLVANDWFSVIDYTAAPGMQSATLTIAPPPKLTCAITPKQKPSCTTPQ